MRVEGGGPRLIWRTGSFFFDRDAWTWMVFLPSRGGGRWVGCLGLPGFLPGFSLGPAHTLRVVVDACPPCTLCAVFHSGGASLRGPYCQCVGSFPSPPPSHALRTGPGAHRALFFCPCIHVHPHTHALHSCLALLPHKSIPHRFPRPSPPYIPPPCGTKNYL